MSQGTGTGDPENLTPPPPPPPPPLDPKHRPTGVRVENVSEFADAAQRVVTSAVASMNAKGKTSKFDLIAGMDATLEVLTRIFGIVAAIVAAGLALTSVVSYLWWPPSRSQTTPPAFTDNLRQLIVLLNDNWTAFLLLLIPFFYGPVKDLVLRAENWPPKFTKKSPMTEGEMKETE